MPVTLGRHELLVRLAAGGAANVFLARDLEAPPPGRLLALKVLLPNLAANEDFLNMFFTEARIAARLKHSNVVRIAGFGRMGGIHCLAMEYVFGASLSQVLRASARARKPLTVGVLLKITGAMCDALHYAHELKDEAGRPMGIVHRDVTPQNILVGFNGVPKLTDFGIAKATNRGWETQAGIVKGKFCYMSPEQALGKKVDRRSDIFCSGIVLWEALTGRELFKGTTPIEVLEAIREQKITQPSKVVPGLSPIVDPIVMKALRRSPKQRYQTAAEMRDDIDDLIRKAGVTIDEQTISKEFASIFGEVIVKRAFALRGAMAGNADLEELSATLGGQALTADHLPDFEDLDDYDEDPLGLFGPDSDPAEDLGNGIGGAIPAMPEVAFTATFKAPSFAEPEEAPIEEIDVGDIDEIADLEPAEIDDMDIEEVDLDEWNDRTRMMEPNDELLAMLSEEDATIGMVPAEFTARFGDVLPPSRRHEVAQFDDEATVDARQARRRPRSTRGRGRASLPATQIDGGSGGFGIPEEETVMQPRRISVVKKPARGGPSSRPVPRAPSLDMAETVQPYREVRTAPGTVSAIGSERPIAPSMRLESNEDDYIPTPISPEMIQPNLGYDERPAPRAPSTYELQESATGQESPRMPPPPPVMTGAYASQSAPEESLSPPAPTAPEPIPLDPQHLSPSPAPEPHYADAPMTPAYGPPGSESPLEALGYDDPQPGYRGTPSQPIPLDIEVASQDALTHQSFDGSPAPIPPAPTPAAPPSQPPVALGEPILPPIPSPPPSPANLGSSPLTPTQSSELSSASLLELAAPNMSESSPKLDMPGPANWQQGPISNNPSYGTPETAKKGRMKPALLLVIVGLLLTVGIALGVFLVRYLDT